MGRYQKLLFLAMMPFGFFFAFVYFVQMFIAATPQQHWCRVPEMEHLDVDIRRNLTAVHVDGVWDRCLTYRANWSEVLETMTAPHPSTPTQRCENGWEFQLGDIPYHTVISERGWVCEYAGFGPLAQAVFFAGSFVGGIFFGWLADTFGRVPALVGTNMMGCIGGVASIFTTGLWDFAFCRFLVGMAYDSCFMMMYILVLEYVGPRHRTWVANMSIALFFGGGCLVLPWLAVWIADWRTLLLATSLPMLAVLAAPLVVPESARWLSSRGRVNQAVKVLKRFERVNGTKIPQDVMDEFIVASRQTRQENESITALFRSGPLRRMMLCMVVVYMGCALIFDGLVRMSEGLGLDFFITFTLASATEIPSVTLLALILDRYGRRMLTVGPLSIAGALTLIASAVPKVSKAASSLRENSKQHRLTSVSRNPPSVVSNYGTLLREYGVQRGHPVVHGVAADESPGVRLLAHTRQRVRRHRRVTVHCLLGAGVGSTATDTAGFLRGGRGRVWHNVTRDARAAHAADHRRRGAASASALAVRQT
ncbi:unnamed protein product [Chilo suppressalis]|uniref:Major facilitator superfamily (MFS) profile domain-containing protein n=1 Tax=Chilo suppressalis TaxID=168631 RepID=A0ABN8L7I3_CHISP|nr:unnamed protein product [Chilo suppressalis]